MQTWNKSKSQSGAEHQKINKILSSHGFLTFSVQTSSSILRQYNTSAKRISLPEFFFVLSLNTVFAVPNR